jgi:hypothetical protein
LSWGFPRAWAPPPPFPPFCGGPLSLSFLPTLVRDRSSDCINTDDSMRETRSLTPSLSVTAAAAALPAAPAALPAAPAPPVLLPVKRTAPGCEWNERRRSWYLSRNACGSQTTDVRQPMSDNRWGGRQGRNPRNSQETAVSATNRLP